VGSISLFLADRADHVTGVEMVQEAVDSARINAEVNNIRNVEFHCSDTRLFLRENRAGFDTLVLDPPRAGLHPKEIPLVNELGAKRILYMSCNPAAFARELPELTNYRLRWIEAHDMFPQTPHVETLALLEGR
jgi:23S rRNA (uracil1939-C5)-methyltransferase